MFLERFLKDRRGVHLGPEERAALEAAITEVRTLTARETIVRAGERLEQSTYLVEGFMSRYIDDRRGLRQLVAVHVPGDFVDLHAYPLKSLDHDVATMTAATVAIVPHAALDRIRSGMPTLIGKLWFATLVEASFHRAWLFRLGRLDALGRVAHFLSETNARLISAGLSEGRRFALGLTQNDLAEICGLTTVHVNRIMRQLREEWLCTFRSSLVEISDPERLARRGQLTLPISISRLRQAKHRRGNDELSRHCSAARNPTWRRLGRGWRSDPGRARWGCGHDDSRCRDRNRPEPAVCRRNRARPVPARGQRHLICLRLGGAKARQGMDERNPICGWSRITPSQSFARHCSQGDPR